MKPHIGTVDHVALWNAINDYAISVGGDPSRHIYGNTTRQKRVVAVERALELMLDSAHAPASGEAHKPAPHPGTQSVGGEQYQMPVTGRSAPGTSRATSSPDAGASAAISEAPTRAAQSVGREGACVHCGVGIEPPGEDICQACQGKQSQPAPEPPPPVGAPARPFCNVCGNARFVDKPFGGGVEPCPSCPPAPAQQRDWAREAAEHVRACLAHWGAPSMAAGEDFGHKMQVRIETRAKALEWLRSFDSAHPIGRPSGGTGR